MPSPRDDLDKGDARPYSDTFEATPFVQPADVPVYPPGQCHQAGIPSDLDDAAILALAARARRYVKEYVQNDQDAEDIVQDVMFELRSQKIRAPAKILRSVAVNNAIDFLRKERRYQQLLRALSGRESKNRGCADPTEPIAQANPEHQQPDADYWCAQRYTSLARERQDCNDPSLPLQQSELKDKVRRATKKLPAHLRLTVALRYELGLTEAEIAGALKIPKGTVKSRLHSALGRLQQQLRKTYDPGT